MPGKRGHCPHLCRKAFGEGVNQHLPHAADGEVAIGCALIKSKGRAYCHVESLGSATVVTSFMVTSLIHAASLNQC